MKINWKRILTGSAMLIGLMSASGYAYLQHPKFGHLPRLSTIEQSPHYIDGQFRNLEPGPVRTLAADDKRKGWLDLLLSADSSRTPPAEIPAERTDLRALDPAQDHVVWLGHSTYYLQLGGKRILIDPVFSENASPVPFTIPAFDGATPYSADDIPDIDYLLISHDHWDHLDYATIMALKDRIGQVVTGLGVGAHFRRWGFSERRVHEADWQSTLRLDEALAIHILPARHFSGRLLTRNQSLWVSYALETRQRRLFFSGDSGYGQHFKAIGDAFGDFDLVMLDSGQYNPQWRHVHMMPEDAVQAADDLNAKAFMPAHVGKFSLAFHSWDDPFRRLSAASQNRTWDLVTPRIGQPVDLNQVMAASSPWWQSLRASE